jgi:3',5'-cyclic AMP phosphodiesterase CpdA
MKRITLLLIISFLCSGLYAKTRSVRFSNGSFKIVQFTDLHWWEDASLKEKNDSTAKLIMYILDSEKPDLAVLTGDIILGSNCRQGWDKLCNIFKEAGIPFVVTLGNHDHESDMGNEEIFQYLEGKPYNLTSDEDASLHGTGNFSLSIKSAEDRGDAWVLYFFDSNSYPEKEGYGTYDWIHPDQIGWYMRTSERVSKKNGRTVPSLAFFHIPLPEYGDTTLAKTIIGNKEENVCSPDVNSGLFSAFLERGDVKGVFVGHDHNNDYLTCIGGKIVLAYGRKTGYPAAYDEVLPRGARIITLNDKEGTFETYIVDLEGKHYRYVF